MIVIACLICRKSRGNPGPCSLIDCREIKMRLACVVFVMIAVEASAPAAPAPGTPIGRAKIVTGKVSVVRGGNTAAIKVGDNILEHDVFETGADGSLGITFSDNTSFAVGPHSNVAVDTYYFDPKNLKGNLTAKLKK